MQPCRTSGILRFRQCVVQAIALAMVCISPVLADTLTLRDGRELGNVTVTWRGETLIVKSCEGRMTEYGSPQVLKWKRSATNCVEPAPVQPGPAQPAAGGVITNSLGMKLVLIPAGEFMMGCSAGDNECEADEKPAHRVRITESFYLGQYTVTQGQWRAVMGSRPSVSEECGNDCPMEGVSWNDAQEFLTKLSEKEGKAYRLPTEAEWEYAARAGTTTRYYWGNEINGDYLWYWQNSGGKTHPVGQKKPNSWGLYDMLNVYQWCSDWYANHYYAQSPASNPTGVTNGTLRLIRGSSAYLNDWNARISQRTHSMPWNGNGSFGFRVLLAAESTPSESGILSLLGKDEKAVLLSLGEPTKRSVFDNGKTIFFEYPSKGVAVRFENNSASTVFCYSGIPGGYETGTYAAYTGELPYGLSFKDTEAELRSRLGAPEASGELSLAPIPSRWWNYKNRGIGLDFVIATGSIIYFTFRKPQ